MRLCQVIPQVGQRGGKQSCAGKRRVRIKKGRQAGGRADNPDHAAPGDGVGPQQPMEKFTKNG